jgi:hypothetical protein
MAADQLFMPSPAAVQAASDLYFRETSTGPRGELGRDTDAVCSIGGSSPHFSGLPTTMGNTELGL